MKEEKLSLLQRCIKWRENNIKEKQFILILSFLVGIDIFRFKIRYS